MGLESLVRGSGGERGEAEMYSSSAWIGQGGGHPWTLNLACVWDGGNQECPAMPEQKQSRVVYKPELSEF